MKAITAALALTLSAQGAFAQQLCISRQAAVDYNRQHNFVTLQEGLTDRDHIIELVQNPDTGAWAILITTPEGMTCLIARGPFMVESMIEPAGIDG